LKLSKTQKFTIIICFAVAAVLFYAWNIGGAKLDWNELLNSTIQSIFGGFIAMALTIWVYRYLYHKKR